MMLKIEPVIYCKGLKFPMGIEMLPQSISGILNQIRKEGGREAGRERGSRRERDWLWSIGWRKLGDFSSFQKWFWWLRKKPEREMCATNMQTYSSVLMRKKKNNFISKQQTKIKPSDEKQHE